MRVPLYADATHVLLSLLLRYLNFNRVWSHGEVWRLASNFLFFDYFSLNWVFHMIFLVPNASQLERHHYRSRTSGFIYMMLIMCMLQLGFAWALFYFNIYRIMFLGPAFSFAVVYVWSRKSMHVQMQFLGLFVFQAPFLPLVMLGVGTALGQSPVFDMLGIASGHLYWFFEDVYPQIKPGRHLTATPRILKMLFDAPPPPVETVPDAEVEEGEELDKVDEPEEADNEAEDKKNR